MLEQARIRPPNRHGSGWPEPGRKILANRLASGTDPFGQNLTSPPRTKSDPDRFRLAAGRKGHNWRDPKWIPAGSGMFTGKPKGKVNFFKHIFVGLSFRNMPPSITMYLSLSFSLLYSITVLQSISCLTSEAEQDPVLDIIS